MNIGICFPVPVTIWPASRTAGWFLARPYTVVCVVVDSATSLAQPAYPAYPPFPHFPRQGVFEALA